MWWEYVILCAVLGVAVAYALWFIVRAFRTPESGCGSSACRCSASDAGKDRMPKVIPLVQIKPDMTLKGPA